MTITACLLIPLRRGVLAVAVLLLLTCGCNRPAEESVADAESLPAAEADTPQAADEQPEPEPVFVKGDAHVPDWIADAVFYQIFPERFRNGDPSNDPTRESLEYPDIVGDAWRLSTWTADWYARADWEQALGDSFYDDGVFHRRYGGDLRGVIEKLDYLKDLGVNVIYFNPVFYGRSLHKYDGVSMHHIDPYFGPDPQGDLELMRGETGSPETWQWTAADKLFLELLGEAKERGIRVIIDGVFNHSGRDFFAFADLREKQEESAYREWYIVQHFDNPDTPQNEFRYKGWWGIDTLPEFANSEDGNDLLEGPRQYILDITSRWMDPNGDGDPSDGIAGWRLDVANEVPTGFWKVWNAHVRELNPQAYTVAEIWTDAYRFLTEGGFSATMNYHGFAFPTKGYLIDGKLTPNDFGLQLEERRSDYPLVMQYGTLNLMDSHDTDRVGSMIVNARHAPYVNADRFDYDVGERASPRHDPGYLVRKPDARERRIQRLVALLQMTYLGAPMIYYGTESGMWGGDDPDDRMPMVWDDMEYDPQTHDPLGREREADEVVFDNDLYHFYKAAIALRKRTAPLRYGSFELVEVDDAAQFFSFRRRYQGEDVLVGINRGDAPYRWRTPAREGDLVEKFFSAAPDSWGVSPELVGGVYEIEVPPLDAVVLDVFPSAE